VVRPALLLLGLWVLAAGCGLDPPAVPPAHEATMPTRDINDVLRAHDDGLLAIPGVVGVYVGLMDNEKTPCLTVLVTKKTREVERKIPATIEGYPVCIEESGVIRPLPKTGNDPHSG
jgi:hypothetical protein